MINQALEVHRARQSQVSQRKHCNSPFSNPFNS